MKEKKIEKKVKIGGGLRKLKRDRRDYSAHRTLGTPQVIDIPDEYFLPSTILTQNGNKCTAYSACAIQETQHGISFDPEWFFTQEGIVNGQDNEEGYDLRTLMQTGVKKGFKSLAGGNPIQYQEESYYRISGPYDLFDSVRAQMWNARAKKKCAELGTDWYSEWTYNAFIPKVYLHKTGGHALKCAGWKKIENVLYMIVQNSYGKGVGDGGYHYFSREVFNKEFAEYGAFVWQPKLSPDQIKRDSVLSDIIIKLIGLYNQIIDLILKANLPT